MANICPVPVPATTTQTTAGLAGAFSITGKNSSNIIVIGQLADGLEFLGNFGNDCFQKDAIYTS
jgi:hypothetical protein